jgi:hypothetical protein
MKTTKTTFCILILSLFFGINSFAQIGFPDDGVHNGDEDNPAAPIDGFIYLLAAGGIAYGYKKIKEKD